MLCRVQLNVLGDLGIGAKGGQLIQEHSEGPCEWRGCLGLVYPGGMISAGVLWEAGGVKPGLCNFAKRKRLEGKGFSKSF